MASQQDEGHGWFLAEQERLRQEQERQRLERERQEQERQRLERERLEQERQRLTRGW